MRTLVLALALVPSLAIAGPKLTLEQVIEKSLAGPRGNVARADVEIAVERLDEAKALALPRIKATMFGTASPEIRCLDAQCTATEPRNFKFDFSGLYGSAQIELFQPIWTFGKATHGFKAAKAGVEAQKALGDEAAGDAVVEAARAFWSVKLARELGYMLDDGIEEIDKAITRMNARTGEDAPSVQDKQRVAVLLAEAKAQRADALAGERQALAGLRALTGIPDADVEDSELAAVEFKLPDTISGENRPQARAAKLGVIAYEELTEFHSAFYFPDLLVTAGAVIARAQGADDPPSAFANDPYNRQGVSAGLAMQWTLEPWTVRARVNRARAEAKKARALLDLATAGASYDAQTALAEATAARAKLEATGEGVKAGRAWVASILQLDALGTAESKDFADAYLAWFGMRAKWAQAAFQWNVAVVRLGRATGEYRVSGYRP